MDEFAIFTRGLVKRFPARQGWVTAVDHLDLQVQRGETYGLIGPDGAGKTTTIRVVLGLLTRTEGESALLGLDSMRDTYQIRERIGYIAQQFVLPADLTVMENMLFFARIQGVERRSARRCNELSVYMVGPSEPAGDREWLGEGAGELCGLDSPRGLERRSGRSGSVEGAGPRGPARPTTWGSWGCRCG